MPRPIYPSDEARITVTASSATAGAVRDLAERYFGGKSSRAGEWLWEVALAALEGSNVLAAGVIPPAEAANLLTARR
jgi:hypothetical protein